LLVGIGTISFVLHATLFNNQFTLLFKNKKNVEVAVVSYEADDEVKQNKLVTLNNEVIPFYLEKLDDIAKENNGFLANGKVNCKTQIDCVNFDNTTTCLSVVIVG
jgi:hypothetical protein